LRGAQKHGGGLGVDPAAEALLHDLLQDKPQAGAVLEKSDLDSLVGFAIVGARMENAEQAIPHCRRAAWFAIVFEVGASRGLVRQLQKPKLHRPAVGLNPLLRLFHLFVEHRGAFLEFILGERVKIYIDEFVLLLLFVE
jgi:hypothetical protein